MIECVLSFCYFHSSRNLFFFFLDKNSAQTDSPELNWEDILIIGYRVFNNGLIIAKTNPGAALSASIPRASICVAGICIFTV